MSPDCFPFNKDFEVMLVVVKLIYLRIFCLISPFMDLGKEKSEFFSLSRGWLGLSPKF